MVRRGTWEEGVRVAPPFMRLTFAGTAAGGERCVARLEAGDTGGSDGAGVVAVDDDGRGTVADEDEGEGDGGDGERCLGDGRW